MNAVDLNIKHQNFQLVIRRRRRLATGGHKTSFHNLCFRTAVAQTSGGEIRPSLFEQFCEGDRTANRSDFANASPSLASALGANDGKAIIDAPETASIAKAAQHRVPFSVFPARSSSTKLPRLRYRRCCGEEDTAPRQKKPMPCRCQNSFRSTRPKQCWSASATSTAHRAPRSAMLSGDLRRRALMRGGPRFSEQRFNEFNREHKRRDRSTGKLSSSPSKRFPEWPLPSLDRP